MFSLNSNIVLHHLLRFALSFFVASFTSYVYATSLASLMRKFFFTHLHCSMPNNDDALTCWISSESIFVKLYHQQSRKGHLVSIGIYSPALYSICVSKRIIEPVGGRRWRFLIRLLPLSPQCRLPFINPHCELGSQFNLAPCRNLCERVAVRGHKGSLYNRGMKYCPKCAIFFRSDEKNFCLCCGKKLRVRTHNSRTRNRNRCSKCNRKLINFSWHDNDEEYSLICWICARRQKNKGLQVSLLLVQH